MNTIPHIRSIHRYADLPQHVEGVTVLHPALRPCRGCNEARGWVCSWHSRCDVALLSPWQIGALGR